MTSASNSINTSKTNTKKRPLATPENFRNLDETPILVKHTHKSFTMPESRSKHPLVWIDCEMTGLDTSKDTIMSLACFVTDYELNMLDDGYEVVIHHSKEQLDQMGEWCTSHHRDSGLTQACLDSTTTAEQAADELLAYIQSHVPERKKALLAGNTVHADQRFLRQEPWRKIVSYLHHRILDVSAIKEAAKRWAPIEVIKASPAKAGKHEAKADILESIAEAKYYKDMFFAPKTTRSDPDVEQPAELPEDAVLPIS